MTAMYVTINLTTIAKPLLVFAINFLIYFYLYRYVFYKNLRWCQKGNICHENRFIASTICSFIGTILFF